MGCPEGFIKSTLNATSLLSVGISQNIINLYSTKEKCLPIPCKWFFKSNLSSDQNIFQANDINHGSSGYRKRDQLTESNNKHVKVTRVESTRKRPSQKRRTPSNQSSGHSNSNGKRKHSPDRTKHENSFKNKIHGKSVFFNDKNYFDNNIQQCVCQYTNGWVQSIDCQSCVPVLSLADNALDIPIVNESDTKVASLAEAHENKKSPEKINHSTFTNVSAKLPYSARKLNAYHRAVTSFKLLNNNSATNPERTLHKFSLTKLSPLAKHITSVICNKNTKKLINEERQLQRRLLVPDNGVILPRSKDDVYEFDVVFVENGAKSFQKKFKRSRVVKLFRDESDILHYDTLHGTDVILACDNTSVKDVFCKDTAGLGNITLNNLFAKETNKYNVWWKVSEKGSNHNSLDARMHQETDETSNELSVVLLNA